MEDIAKEYEDFRNLIEGDYPEAFFYYIFGKLFRWSPKDIDELDIELCCVLIEMDKKTNEQVLKELEKETPSEPKFIKRRENRIPESFPEEWEMMSVKDILNSEEFQERAKRDRQLVRTMFEKHRVK